MFNIVSSMLNKKTISVIGSGFAGMASATELASMGASVRIFEKNHQAGGRARKFEAQGFSFDMGPSWYWMPDVMERYFGQFGKSVDQYFELKQLDPGFQIIFDQEDILQIPADQNALYDLFESIETGSGKQLQKFLDSARFKYEVGMNSLVYSPGLSLREYMKNDVISGIFKLQLFSSFKSYVAKYFRNKKLRALMEFPVLFLGAMPSETPALYSLMNFAGLRMGTFYPMGGMVKLVEAMKELATEKGVEFFLSKPVSGIDIKGDKASGIITADQVYETDGIIAAGDYHHVESKLLPPEKRNYAEKYWDKRVFAPSSLIFYLGVSKKIKRLIHHNLFFQEDLDQHAIEIYKNPKWPSAPLYYVCCPSKTDSSVAPDGMENLFILMPLAPGLRDTEELREKYFHVILDNLEKFTGEKIRDHIIYKKAYCIKDFKNDYNAYKGNAYGLANTLTQTAIFKPKLINKKIKNLVYAGQLTVPGPGVPPSIISGGIAARQLTKNLNQ